jgi:hypothetical protein
MEQGELDDITAAVSQDFDRGGDGRTGHDGRRFDSDGLARRGSDNGAPSSDTCPVVTYKDVTTWAFSYTDNRVSMALVSYDRNNNVIANVEKPGARYVFAAESSIYTETVLFFGQAGNHVTATWAELGPK